MKISLFSFLMLCFLQNTFCQISGTLIAANNEPIPFANVLLLKSVDTALIKAALTDEKGAYQIESVGPGNYILRFSSMGYQTWDSPLFEWTKNQKDKDFGVQIMQENARQMVEVAVRAEKPLFQQQPYGTIINVESSVLTKGSSALQVLERSPGVIIDYQNNSIALHGKNGVVVMINGKLMRMPMEQLVALLNGMSANEIEKIELLTTPPARYDADGSAGMINIVLKKNKKPGTNGSVSFTGGYGWGEKGTGSIGLAHNKGMIDLYGSAALSHDRSYNYLVGESSQNFPALGGQMDVLFWNTTKPLQNNYDVTFGLDARVNTKTTIGGNITYNGSKASSAGFNRREFNVFPDSLLLFNGAIKGASRWRNLVSTVYAEKKIREGEKLTLDFNYLYYKNGNSTDVNSTFIDKNGNEAGTNNDTLFSPRQIGSGNTIIQVGVVKMDYAKQLSQKIKLETGIKATHTWVTSLSGIKSLVNGAWTNRQETSNEIAMKESIGAAYASVNTQINTSASLVIGFRYEHSHTHIENAKTEAKKINGKLGVLFPGIFFSKKLTERSELQLSYTKRISRPSYNDLSSFVAYNDPVSVFTGNPLLKPTITNNLKMGYTYRGYSFSLLLSRDDDPIARYQITSSPLGDLLYVSPQNLTYQNNLTFQTNLPWKVNSWWDMTYSLAGGLRQFKVDYSKHPFRKTYLGYSVSLTESFKLPKGWSLEISGWYNGASYNGTVKTDGFGVLNAGIKKEIKNNGGTFQLSVADLLKTLKYKNYYGTLTEEAFNGKSQVTYNPESGKTQIIKFTYFKSFGNGSMKGVGKQNNGSQDERERVRKD